MTVLYVIIAVLLFGLLIFIHELGHFLVARAFKIQVNEFSIGMGPKIVSKVSAKSGIRYSFRGIPFGGYVSMDGEGNESASENAFCNKPIWQRMLVIAAGPFMNLVLGFLAMTIIVTWNGISYGRFASNTVGAFIYSETGEIQSISCDYGLEVGDKIVKVGNTPTHTGDEVAYEILNKGYEAIDLTVVRNGEKLVLEDVCFPTFKDDETDVLFGDADFKMFGEKATFATVIKHSFYKTCSTVKMVWDSLIGMITGRFGFDSVSGPVGVTKTIANTASEAAEAGRSFGDIAKTLLYYLAVLTVNLGVFNFIPFPALDGGQFLLLFIQLITGKKISQKAVGAINFAGLMILFSFMIAVTLKDIAGLF